MIQACLNGRRTREEHSGVPLTPGELAREGRAAVDAGAASLHVHPRGVDGEETLDDVPRASALRALRAACPGIEVSVTTGFWIVGDAARRLERIATWTELPDLASVNISEPGAVELCGVLSARGIGIEAGVSSVADTRTLLASGVLARSARVLIEVQGETAPALAEIDAIDALLDQAGVTLPRLDHGYGLATWAVIDRAARRGHDVRIGLEDTLMLPGGRRAGGNAELVAACRARSILTSP